MPEPTVDELREAAVHAVLDALSWMDPDTARKWRGEPSYKRLAEMLCVGHPIEDQ